MDVAALSFVCVSAPRPKLVNQDTGEVKVDRNGQTVFQVGLSAANESGRVELLVFLREQAVAITAHRFGTPSAIVDALPVSAVD